jgi:two-component system sensor histidine kinase UhpB
MDHTEGARRRPGAGRESLTSSNGIRGVRERAMLIGADLSVESPAAGGTEVRLTIPGDF